MALSPLAWNLRMSLGLLARKLGVDEGTVRNRVRALHATGFIHGWRTVLNPALFGGGEVLVLFDVGDPASKDEVIEAARLLSGVTLINVFHGKGMGIILRYGDEVGMRREVDLLLRLAHAEWRVLGRIPFPPCHVRLTAADGAVLRSLRDDPRKPAATIARETGLSTRTVRRRVERLVDARALFALPGLDPKAVAGAFMALLFVTCPTDLQAEIDAAVADHLDEYLWHALHTVPWAEDGLRPCAYNLFLPNLAKAREVLRWAHDLPGVAECRLELFEDVETRFDVFDAEALERPAVVLPTPRAGQRSVMKAS